MHVVFRETRGIEESDTPVDLGQSPADLVALSYSDSDLTAFAEGWRRGGGAQGWMPTLRLANLASLRHPLSVDTYVERTLEGAKGILVRLIGGVPYWSYGLRQVSALARERGLALAILPADGRPDARLDAFSTLPSSTLKRLAHLCDTGGAVAAQAALAQLALAAGLYAEPVSGAKVLPQVGGWTPEHGLACPATLFNPLVPRPGVLLVFYRAYLTSADLAPVTDVFRALRQHGFQVGGLFVPSLKTPTASSWLARQTRTLRPDAIVNLTAFSGRDGSNASPLDAADVPVFQAALATSGRKAWEESDRGLSAADLAMHVVLPEIDGRIFGGVVSFKEPGQRDSHLQVALTSHRPDRSRTAALADRVTAWINLARKPVESKKLALVLSTYPGQDWNMAHAVGLDPLASVEAMLEDLQDAGYAITSPKVTPLARSLQSDTLHWPLDAYRQALSALPRSLQDALHDAWGPPERDPDFRNGMLRLRAARHGAALVALQPERGIRERRDDDYHDLTRIPRHSYVAFYLWLCQWEQVDAIVHVGAHGTLEWLPGKSVALSGRCWPEALVGPVPVIYPFIVNDPGEAVQAKRRLGAVTLGHIPPPLRRSRTADSFAGLESLLDEFSTADGLDPSRRDRLRDSIREEARALGVEADLGLDSSASPAEAITRIDRFVCDIKDSQFGDGLHVFGRVPEAPAAFDAAACAEAERTSLVAALAGGRIEPGPSGSPYRGRHDVLPTGRNIYSTDPRAVPTPTAHTQGLRQAEELVRRHLQDEGDYPRRLIVDLWGSATIRTAGEEFAMALHLLGVRPVWDTGSGRVSGLEIIPIAELERPRLDVTLRVSGLFRDVFPTLTSLFEQAIGILAERDEAPDWNPFAGKARQPRVYGPAPGSYGLGMGTLSAHSVDDFRLAAGKAWFAASSWALAGDSARRDEEGIRDRVAMADSFVHPQDLPETDLLLAADYANHEAGFASAQSLAGGNARLYHLDNTRPDAPRARTLTEEIARVLRARAIQPGWIAGMCRHGFRGAAEVAATLDHLATFARLADVVPGHLFDLYHDATLGNGHVAEFLKCANPEAYRAMQDRFAELHATGLWQTRRNSIVAEMRVAE